MAKDPRGGDGAPAGYGRPPVATRFQKGRSGNPKGRPRKARKELIDASSLSATLSGEREFYRTVDIREGGKPVSMPIVNAIWRKRLHDALTGKNRLLQREVLQEAEALEQRKLEADVRRFFDLTAQKTQGEARLRDAAARGLPEPELLPHPDDIHIDDLRTEAQIVGPTTPAELGKILHMANMRDEMLLRSEHAERHGTAQHMGADGQRGCTWQVLAHYVDRMLPKRFRWTEQRCRSLMLELHGLPTREIDLRMKAALAANLIAWKQMLPLTADQEWAVAMMERAVRGRRG